MRNGQVVGVNIGEVKQFATSQLDQFADDLVNLNISDVPLPQGQPYSALELCVVCKLCANESEAKQLTSD